MSKHETKIRQAPGWWANLCEAVCSCGWKGPTRDVNKDHDNMLVRSDGPRHVEEMTGSWPA